MRMIKYTGLVIIFLIVAISSKASEIKFISEAYAGDDFSFYIIPNFLTENQVVIGNGTVTKKGHLAANSTYRKKLPSLPNLMCSKDGLF